MKDFKLNLKLNYLLFLFAVGIFVGCSSETTAPQQTPESNSRIFDEQLTGAWALIGAPHYMDGTLLIAPDGQGIEYAASGLSFVQNEFDFNPLQTDQAERIRRELR